MSLASILLMGNIVSMAALPWLGSWSIASVYSTWVIGASQMIDSTISLL